MTPSKWIKSINAIGIKSKAGKYGVGQSNVLTLNVGQIDYSRDIDAVAKALEQAKNNELQRTITIICIVLCVLICLYVAFVV